MLASSIQCKNSWEETKYSSKSNPRRALFGHKKLAYRYCGPFKVTKTIGEQAYKLELPPHLHVQNVFHVNILKQYILDPSHILDHDDTILVSQEKF